MVEVTFACIPEVEGVRCTLDGVTVLSDSSGIAYFYDIAQGDHTYSIEPPKGIMLLTGEDPFKRPLLKSGTTTIEWVLIPGQPWPEDLPWTMAFTFAEIPWLTLTALPFALGALTVGMCIIPINYMK